MAARKPAIRRRHPEMGKAELYREMGKAGLTKSRR